MLHLLLPVLLLGADPMTAQGQPENLALKATATAFEFYGDFRPENANDGNADTRWSGIPGHNQGGWFQLTWTQPVKVAEVIVRQYGTFTKEMDLQVWDLNASTWKTVKHFGTPDAHLRGTVSARFDPVMTDRVRLFNITNGPTFREVEVYSEPYAAYKPEIHAASDLQGNIVGIVTDQWGAEPIGGGRIRIRYLPDGKTRASDGDFPVNENGMFSIPTTPEWRGQYEFVAMNPTGKELATKHIDAANFQYGLTELGNKPKVTSLDGTWKFMGDPPKGFEKPDFDDSGWKGINVPAHWEMEGFVVRSGHGGYRKKFNLPPGSGRLKIRFDSVYSGCEVYCNGELVARHVGGATPFEADLTDVATPGENVLAVDVVEHTVASDHLDKMSIYAYFHLAGIWRSVYLFRVPETHLQRFEWNAFREPNGDATVLLWADFLSELGGEFRGSLEANLRDHNGQAIASTPLKVDNIRTFGSEFAQKVLDAQNYSGRVIGMGRMNIATGLLLSFKKPTWWTAEQPRLYQLDLALKDEKGKTVQTITRRVGFRQTSVKGTEILINGTPVKFRGTCHHDQDPMKGRAVSEADTRRDLELMKEANLNAVRTSHYPPHPSLPEIADELGIYVEDEAPFCWADAADDLRVAPLILQHTAELIARDRNHPSVVWWSMANESSYGWGFWRALEWAKKADPSRPASAATSAQPGDEKGNSTAKLDIYTLHNPIATNRIEDAEKNLKGPLIFDESLCIYQGIFGDVAEMWLDPGMRDYYVAPLIKVYQDFMKSKVTQGSFIWCWSDDIFCVPNRGLEYGREATRSHFLESSYLVNGRGLVGDAPWGVVDGWRRKKPEFFHTKMLHDPKRVGIPAAIIEPKFPEPESTNTLTTWDTSDLSGSTFHIAGAGFELGFSYDGGYLRQCVVDGMPLLLEFPALHVLPTATPLSPMPALTSWQFKGLKIDRDGKNVKVRIEGAYDKFEGHYDWTITPEGEATVESEFKYSGDDIMAREVGLRFSVPRECDDLHWKRNSEWNDYPNDHIGRPMGEARPFTNTKQGGPPSWSFAEDYSIMGSNDFRSTKRNIVFASIGYSKEQSKIQNPKSKMQGSLVQILSNGTQSLRAMAESDRISIHINDLYGGTNVGLGEWITNYGRGKLIKKGDVLKSTLRLRLVP